MSNLSDSRGYLIPKNQFYSFTDNNETNSHIDKYSKELISEDTINDNSTILNINKEPLSILTNKMINDKDSNLSVSSGSIMTDSSSNIFKRKLNDIRQKIRAELIKKNQSSLEMNDLDFPKFQDDTKSREIQTMPSKTISSEDDNIIIIINDVDSNKEENKLSENIKNSAIPNLDKKNSNFLQENFNDKNIEKNNEDTIFMDQSNDSCKPLIEPDSPNAKKLNFSRFKNTIIPEEEEEYQNEFPSEKKSNSSIDTNQKSKDNTQSIDEDVSEENTENSSSPIVIKKLRKINQYEYNKSLISITKLDLEDILLFVYTSIDPGITMQFTMFRKKDTIWNSIIPEYNLVFTENINYHILSAKKKYSFKGISYTISSDKHDFDINSPFYCGILEGSILGTDYMLFDIGEKLEKLGVYNESMMRSQLCSIRFKKNIFGNREERTFQILIPKIKFDETQIIKQRTINKNEILALYKNKSNKIFSFTNNHAVFSECKLKSPS